MEKVYCSLKNCNVTIWREKILANSVEDITNMMIQGRYCCSNNDAWCDCEDVSGIEKNDTIVEMSV